MDLVSPVNCHQLIMNVVNGYLYVVRFFSSLCSSLFPNFSILVIFKRLFKTHSVQWYRCLVQSPIRKFRCYQVGTYESFQALKTWAPGGALQGTGLPFLKFWSINPILVSLFWPICPWSTLNHALLMSWLDSLNYVLTGNLILWMSSQQPLTVNFMLMPSKSKEPIIFFPPKFIHFYYH